LEYENRTDQLSSQYTAYCQETVGLVEEALNNSAYTCLYKPVDKEEILRLVEEIQARKRHLRHET